MALRTDLVGLGMPPGLSNLLADAIQGSDDGLSPAELDVLDGVTAGTVTASKAVVVDANKDITAFRNVTGVNYDAGASGTAGTVDVFPTTAAKGKLAISCTDQTTDTTVGLVAGAMGQATVVTIPDPGASTADVVLTAGAQTVAGVKTYTGNNIHSGTFVQGSNATDRVTIKGHYMNPSVISVAVPTIANDAAENVDRVDVDVSAAFSIQPAVGDAVIAIPMAALPTDCVLLGAFVSATDHIIVSFGSIEGGGGVTGASVNFNFLVIDLT